MTGLLARYVITAMHCLYEVDEEGVATRLRTAEDIKIRIKAHNLMSDSKYLNVRSVTMHPDYSQTIGKKLRSGVSILTNNPYFSLLPLLYFGQHFDRKYQKYSSYFFEISTFFPSLHLPRQ